MLHLPPFVEVLPTSPVAISEREGKSIRLVLHSVNFEVKEG